MIHSFYFLCVEIHLSFSARSARSTQDLPGLLPPSWSDNPENVPGLDGNIRCEKCPAFCTPWRLSELLQNMLRDVHVPWHWALINRHEWWFMPAQYWTRNIRQCISQNSRGCHGEPMIASKSSNVVSSGIAFEALDLITRPSPFRATVRS